MSKEKEILEGLEENQGNQNSEATETKKEKVQTPEELASIVAGIAKIKEFGVSEKFATVMELVAEWNGDKAVLSVKKEEVIAKFEGSEKLKDYVDTDFQKELAAIQGIAKTASILNNIKAFYARRAATAKTKFIQVNISGTIYNVNSTFYAELNGKGTQEKRDLILAHADTVEAPVVAEIL